jgi:hypothetical protein
MPSATRRLRPLGDDNYRWLVSGIKYLLEVDAQAPGDRRRLVALRRRVSRRSEGRVRPVGA